MDSDKRFEQIKEEVKEKVAKYYISTGQSPKYLIVGWDDKNVIHTHGGLLCRLRNKFNEMVILINEDSDEIDVR